MSLPCEASTVSVAYAQNHNEAAVNASPAGIYCERRPRPPTM
jgi:hypothetical protein